MVRAHPGRFQITALTAENSWEKLAEQALEFNPQLVVIGNEEHYPALKAALKDSSCGILVGEKGIIDAAVLPETDMVLTALVGFAGLQPTLAAIAAGKDIGLANKETLVVAGELVMRRAREKGVHIIPVDSEHSAIFQCLSGEENNPVEKIILTASGGPFRGKTREELRFVTSADALKHPNWVMGAKITIDSASMMNKGLEVIEAKWLFDLEVDQIDVVIHPQSIIHSMVQFTDGSIKAQMGLPDMKLPIQYAMAWPQRIKNSFERFDFGRYSSLTFEQPDKTAFRNLGLAYQALRDAGNMPCIVNAANEIVVAGFLKNRIDFLGMSRVIEKCMVKMAHVRTPALEDYLETDRETRALATELVTSAALFDQKGKLA